MLDTLFEFFGILGGTLTAPTTVFELLQWIIKVGVGIGLVVFILRLFRYIVTGITTGGRRL